MFEGLLFVVPCDLIIQCYISLLMFFLQLCMLEPMKTYKNYVNKSILEGRV